MGVALLTGKYLRSNLKGALPRPTKKIDRKNGGSVKPSVDSCLKRFEKLQRKKTKLQNFLLVGFFKIFIFYAKFTITGRSFLNILIKFSQVQDFEEVR